MGCWSTAELISNVRAFVGFYRLSTMRYCSSSLSRREKRKELNMQEKCSAAMKQQHRTAQPLGLGLFDWFLPR